jgi:hypothetical protein
LKRIIGMVALLATAAFVAGGGAATAAKLVTGKNIKDGSITLKDLSRSTRSALKGAQGSPGAPGRQGTPGPAGPAGPTGPGGTSSLAIALGDTRFLCAGGGPAGCDVGVSEARCPAGMVATGGGYEYEQNAPVNNVVPINSSNSDGTGWIVGLINYSAINADFFAVAHCAPGTIKLAGAGLSKVQAEGKLAAQLRAATR